MQNLPPVNDAFSTAHDVMPLRQLDASDWQAFADWARHICVAHGRGDDALARVNAAPDDLWQRELSQDDWKFFAAIDQGKIVCLGRVGKIVIYPNALEAVLEVRADYQRHGIGTRMLTAMRSYVAEHHRDKDMVARIQPINVASRRSAEKAGLSYSGYTEPSVHGQPGYMVYRVSLTGPDTKLAFAPF